MVTCDFLEQLRWIRKTRNRTTSPTYLADGTPMVVIPNHVLMYGLENHKEYVIGQFYRCSSPSGGLIHAVTNRIWGKKCKIFTHKLGESTFLFHIPDETTRTWVLERGFWHIDGCIMFVAPWSLSASLALPEIYSVPMWVTLKNIPSCLYSLWGISWIASGLGAPMLSNKLWLDPLQMVETKLMVEVELDKGFPQRIAATDEIGNITMVSVEYSWIPSKCERCGHLGHKESRCLLLSKPKTLDPNCSLVTSHIAATNLLKEVAATTIEIASQAIDTPIANASALHGSPLAFASHVTSIGVASITPSTCVVASTTTTPLSCEVAETTTFITNKTEFITTPISNTKKAIVFDPPLPMVPPFALLLNSVVSEIEANVFESNYASLDSDDPSQKTRGGRIIKPTQKLQEMDWIKVEGRKNRGRGGKKTTKDLSLHL